MVLCVYCMFCIHTSLNLNLKEKTENHVRKRVPGFSALSSRKRLAPLEAQVKTKRSAETRIINTRGIIFYFDLNETRPRTRFVYNNTIGVRLYLIRMIQTRSPKCSKRLTREILTATDTRRFLFSIFF